MEIKLVLLIVMSTARVAKGIECYVCGLNETDAIAAARNCKQNPGSLVATCSSESYCVSILTGDLLLLGCLPEDKFLATCNVLKAIDRTTTCSICAENRCNEVCSDLQHMITTCLMSLVSLVTLILCYYILFKM